MTVEEMAELAIRKRDLDTELKEIRQKLKDAARTMELPVIVVLNGEAVHIAKPQFAGAVPPCKIARAVCTPGGCE